MSIEDDVVDEDQKAVIGGPHPIQAGPEERPSFEVERATRFYLNILLQPSFPLLVRLPTQVYVLEGQLPRPNTLIQSPIPCLERRPKYLVAVYNPAQGRLQDLRIQGASETERVCYVVRCALRLKPIDDPQSFLKKGRREDIGLGKSLLR